MWSHLLLAETSMRIYHNQFGLINITRVSKRRQPTWIYLELVQLFSQESQFCSPQHVKFYSEGYFFTQKLKRYTEIIRRHTSEQQFSVIHWCQFHSLCIFNNNRAAGCLIGKKGGSRRHDVGRVLKSRQNQAVPCRKRNSKIIYRFIVKVDLYRTADLLSSCFPATIALGIANYSIWFKLNPSC